MNYYFYSITFYSALEENTYFEKGIIIAEDSDEAVSRLQYFYRKEDIVEIDINFLSDKIVCALNNDSFLNSLFGGYIYTTKTSNF